uniref:LEM domain-containing protein n=1 Tax=Oryzias latipes TaxID=8090 RepID=H2MF12_ORYLA
MPFVEDPAHLSIARLKSDLLAHNVALPPAASKKEVYVELHLKNIDQKNAAEFSSDDEEETREAARESSDPSDLTDEYLREALLKHGVKAGPIVASTRTLYENKLRKLLLHSNGDDELYSDSEEEQEKRDDIESGGIYFFSNRIFCFIVSENCFLSQLSAYLFPDTKPTTTGIYVTPRRPIKGAAQRPVQYSYSYPDTLVSPVTLERREVERRLVSIHIQILFFFFVACILFYIYVNVQDSTVLALLDSFSHCFDKEGWAFLQPGTEGTQAVCKQD